MTRSGLRFIIDSVGNFTGNRTGLDYRANARSRQPLLPNAYRLKHWRGKACSESQRLPRPPLRHEEAIGGVVRLLPVAVADLVEVLLHVGARSEEHTSELQSRPHLV